MTLCCKMKNLRPKSGICALGCYKQEEIVVAGIGVLVIFPLSKIRVTGRCHWGDILLSHKSPNIPFALKCLVQRTNSLSMTLSSQRTVSSTTYLTLCPKSHSEQTDHLPNHQNPLPTALLKTKMRSIVVLLSCIPDPIFFFFINLPWSVLRQACQL